MNYRLSERMMLSACAAGILIVMLGNRRQSLSMSAVGAGMRVLGLLQALLFCKCPHCKKRFKLGSRRPSVRPYGGAKLEDPEPEKQAETKQVEPPAEAGEENDE